MILYLATVVEQKHRFWIFDLDRTRDFISRPSWKNITDMLLEYKSGDFEARSQALLSGNTRQPGSKVEVSGQSLNSRVSSSMLKKLRFRDFTAQTLTWFYITDNEKGNHARGNIISRVNSRSKITGARGVISPEFSPCRNCSEILDNWSWSVFFHIWCLENLRNFWSCSEFFQKHLKLFRIFLEKF